MDLAQTATTLSPPAALARTKQTVSSSVELGRLYFMPTSSDPDEAPLKLTTVARVKVNVRSVRRMEFQPSVDDVIE